MSNWFNFYERYGVNFSSVSGDEESGYNGKTVCFKCKITNQITEGVIHHMIGGSFGLEGPRYRSIYKYHEVNIYKIKKNSYDN